MEYYWDAFISKHGDELADLSLREALEKYHNWLQAKGVIGGPKKADAKPETEPELFPAFLVTWTESEAGWGQRPDGVSLHLTKDVAAEYIKAYWDRMPSREELGGRVPDEYTRNDNDGSLIMVDRETRDKMAGNDNKSISMGNRTFSEMRKNGQVKMDGDF